MNRLSDKEKEWLQKSIDQSIPFQRKLWIKSEKKSIKAVIKAGVKVIYPDKKIFQEATKAMYLNFKKDKSMSNLIDRIRNEAN